MTIADTIRTALDAAEIPLISIVETKDGVGAYVPRFYEAETFSTVGAAINAAGLRARPMVPAYGWFVRSGDAP